MAYTANSPAREYPAILRHCGVPIIPFSAFGIIPPGQESQIIIGSSGERLSTFERHRVVPGYHAMIPVQIADRHQSERLITGILHGVKDLLPFTGKGININHGSVQLIAWKNGYRSIIYGKAYMENSSFFTELLFGTVKTLSFYLYWTIMRWISQYMQFSRLHFRLFYMYEYATINMIYNVSVEKEGETMIIAHSKTVVARDKVARVLDRVFIEVLNFDEEEGIFFRLSDGHLYHIKLKALYSLAAKKKEELSIL